MLLKLYKSVSLCGVRQRDVKRIEWKKKNYREIKIETTWKDRQEKSRKWEGSSRNINELY